MPSRELQQGDIFGCGVEVDEWQVCNSNDVPSPPHHRRQGSHRSLQWDLGGRDSEEVSGRGFDPLAEGSSQGLHDQLQENMQRILLKTFRAQFMKGICVCLMTGPSGRMHVYEAIAENHVLTMIGSDHRLLHTSI